ncbi:unnamed protein product [Malus baccata var. baccata]
MEGTVLITEAEAEVETTILPLLGSTRDFPIPVLEYLVQESHMFLHVLTMVMRFQHAKSVANVVMLLLIASSAILLLLIHLLGLSVKFVGNLAILPYTPSDQFWVADTGATSHMTSDLANLNFATPFSGSDTSLQTLPSPTIELASPSSTQSQIPIDPDFQIEQLPVVLPLPSVSLHPMQTRSKSGISKRKVFTATVQSSAQGSEPTSYKSASKCPKWQAAMQEEIDALHAQNTWSLVPLPSGKNLVGLYMTQPPGFQSVASPSQYVCKLNKSLYGLKQAPRAWNERFTSYLPGLGFQSSFADPSLFVKHNDAGTVVLLLYVDDIILTGSSSTLIDDVIVQLTKEFDMKDLGQLNYFLGLQVSYHSGGLFVSQSKYIKDLLNKVDLQDSKPCSTPCLPSHRLLKDDGDPYHSPEQYRSIVGALQYVTFTRPDIAFSVNQCCQFMHSPMTSHVVAVKRILRYLSGTLDYGLHFKPGQLHLQAYSDADWAGDPNDRRSTSGHIVYLGSSPISWASKKQHTVSRSSTEAEYRALAIAAAELAWIRQLLCDLHVSVFTAPVIYCDNISAIALSSNPVFHSRVKHIEIDYHFVRERVIRGDLNVCHVSSKEQVADILTKGLAAPLFQSHCSNLMLSSIKHEIAGGCKDVIGGSDLDKCT